ncbi:MAG: amidophosphoribosyltransferase [bacterium]
MRSTQELSEIKEFCGIFGIYDHPRAAELTFLGLHALQHRGQESAGIVSSDGKQIRQQVGLGLVTEVFFDRNLLLNLTGRMAIGHNRYSTTGLSALRNAGPQSISCDLGILAVAHNGNLVNTAALRDQLSAQGVQFSSSTDSELLLHLVSRSQQEKLVDRIRDALSYVDGAYSLIFMTTDSLVAVRDPRGFKPLCLGRKDDAVVFASESCALDQIEAQFVRELEAGEMVLVDANGERSVQIPRTNKLSQCIFELIYFARADSRIFSAQVEHIRRSIGRALAEEKPAPSGDIVIAVPDSSRPAAQGYAQRAGLPFETGLIRNHLIGRTFIQPSQLLRDLYTRLKFAAVDEVLRGRRVVVVDDSIVRGTTFRNLTRLIRRMGAAEIHLRISSPPICHPCHFGMDFPSRQELIAASRDLDEIRDFLQVDSLEYLSIEKLLETIPIRAGEYCAACFNGIYPIQIMGDADKRSFEEEPNSWMADLRRSAP